MRDTVEKHIQTVVVIITAGLIAWAGMSLQEVHKSIASMTVQISTLQSEVTTLREISQGQYTQAEASKDWGRYYQDMKEVRERIRALEQSR